MTQKDVAIAIVVRADKVLICRRKANDSFGGYWEFPGGKREAGESAEQCLIRELKEELDLVVLPIGSFPAIVHDYGTVCVRLLPYLCSADNGEPRAIACERIAWVKPADLRNYKFPSANALLIEQIIQRLLSPAPLDAGSAPGSGSSPHIPLI